MTVPAAERTALERSPAFRAYEQRREDALAIPERADSTSGVKRGGKAASGNGRTRSPSGTSGKAGGPKAPAKPRKTAAKSKSKAPAAKRTRTAKGAPAARGNGAAGAVTTRKPVGTIDHAPKRRARREDLGLTPTETRLLDDLFAIVEEHASDSAVQIDRDEVGARLRLRLRAPRRPAAQVGRGLHHPPGGVAKICAGMRLDTETLCAALLHDTVEDTSASLDEVREQFGDEVASLVDGVTKLTGITFQSRDEAQAENYRKMMVAMASDIRVILIKLADRLHNMRTLERHAEAEADRQGQGDARHLRARRAPPRHPRHQVGARGPRLRHASPAQVPGDQEPGGPAARGARALRREGGRVPAQGAVGAGHRGGDLRPRQALLFDLLEDDQEGPRVQRDLRPHGDARASSTRSRTATARWASSTRCGSRCPGASRTSSRCPSSTCTSRCTRR